MSVSELDLLKWFGMLCVGLVFFCSLATCILIWVVNREKERVRCLAALPVCFQVFGSEASIWMYVAVMLLMVAGLVWAVFSVVETDCDAPYPDTGSDEGCNHHYYDLRAGRCEHAQVIHGRVYCSRKGCENCDRNIHNEEHEYIKD